MAKLEDSINKSRNCNALWFGDMNFEVEGTGGGTAVSLNMWTCTCRAWQLSGIPCCHAVSAITYKIRDPQDCINECLKGEMYLKCYGYLLDPVNGLEKWPDSDKSILLPPPQRVVKGRPRWNRRKDALEDGKGKGINETPDAQPVEDEPFKMVKKSRKGIKMTCRNCKEDGHNIRKCPNRPVHNDVPEGESGEAVRGTQIPPQMREKEPVRRIGSGSRSATMGERNNVVVNMTSTIGLQPSFTRRNMSFITSQELQQQSKSKKNKSWGIHCVGVVLYLGKYFCCFRVVIKPI